MPALDIFDPNNYEEDDFVRVGSVWSPGVIPPGGISGAEREYKYDVKEGKGTKGSTTTFTNVPPVKFSIKFLLWLSEHMKAWDAFMPLLKYDPTKKSAQAFDIWHPALAELGITSVVTTKIGLRVHEGEGLYSRTVEFLEYLPASKTSTVSTPNGSSPAGKEWQPDAPGNAPDPAIAAAQKEIDELSKKAQAA